MTSDWSTSLRALGLDRYDLMARLRPALFTLLPVFLVVGVRVPEARTAVGAVVSAATACGVTYFLVLLARWQGRALEQRLGDRAGRRHSARLLTFEDPTFARETKTRYHAFLSRNGIRMSSPEEERVDPALAFDRSRSAIDWLLFHTQPRAKQTLLFDENISYGFTRNLRGLKPIAIGAVLLMLAVNGAMTVQEWLVQQSTTSGVLIEAATLVMLALWIFLVSTNAVTQASLAYAQRLLGHCEAVVSQAASHSGAA